MRPKIALPVDRKVFTEIAKKEMTSRLVKVHFAKVVEGRLEQIN